MHAPVRNLDYAPMRTAQFAERGPLIEAELPRRRRVDTAGNDPQQKLRSNRAGCCALAMYRTDIGLCIESRFIAVEQDLGGQSPLKTNGSSAAPALRTTSCGLGVTLAQGPRHAAIGI